MEDCCSYCRKNGITVIAYSRLARGLENIKAADPEGVLRKVAEAYSKSEAQVAVNCCNRKENVIAIPKASTAACVMESAGASGWKLRTELARLLEDRIRCRSSGTLQIAARRAVRWDMRTIGRWQARALHPTARTGPLSVTVLVEKRPPVTLERLGLSGERGLEGAKTSARTSILQDSDRSTRPPQTPMGR